jgi:hypothetical protein
MITAGLILFNLCDENASKKGADSLIGIALCFASLMCDGATGSRQDKVNKAYVVTSNEHMFFTNLFGIVPTGPHTGYGYIRRGHEGPASSYAVDAFFEKPDRSTAEGYVAGGNYFWNSGIFVLHARTFLAEMAELAPEVLGSSTRPSGWRVSLIVPPKEIKEKEDTPADDEADASDPTSEGALDEAVRAVRIGQVAKLSAAIKKLQPPTPKALPAAAESAVAPEIEAAPAAEGGSSAEKLNALRARYDALLGTLQSECIAAEAHEQRLELAIAHLTNQEALCERGDAAALAALVGVADELIALIDMSALAAAYGVTLDKDDKVMTSIAI